MPVLGNILGGLIGNALEATHPVQLNPDLVDPDTGELKATHVNAQGEYTDNTGKVIPIVQQPKFWARTLSPDNAAIQQSMYDNYMTSPILAQQAEANRMVTPSYNLAQTTAKNTANMGGAQAGANATVSGLNATTEENNARIRKAAVGNLLDNPEKEAGVENQGLTYKSGLYAGDTALLPQEYKYKGALLDQDTQDLNTLRPLQRQYGLLSLTGDINAQPALNTYKLYGANIEAANAAQDYGLLPYTQGTRRIDAMKANSLAPLIGSPDPMAMGAITIDPETGVASYGRNPLGSPLMGGNQPTKVPGLPNAFVPAGMGPNMQEPTTGLQNSPSPQSAADLIPLDDGMHATDQNGQLYYNRGTMTQPNYIPIQSGTNELQQKALDTIKKRKLELAKHKELQAKLETSKAKLEHPLSHGALSIIGNTGINMLNDLGGYVLDAATPDTWGLGTYKHRTFGQHVSNSGQLIGRLGSAISGE